MMLNAGSGHSMVGDIRLDIEPYPEVNLVGDIQDIGLPDKHVDESICISVLEHVPDPYKAVRELCRVTKSRIVIEIPVNSDLRKDMVRILCPTPNNIRLALTTRKRAKETLWQINPLNIKALMESQGFKTTISKLYSIYHDWFSRCWRITGVCNK